VWTPKPGGRCGACSARGGRHEASGAEAGPAMWRPAVWRWAGDWDDGGGLWAGWQRSSDAGLGGDGLGGAGNRANGVGLGGTGPGGTRLGNARPGGNGNWATSRGGDYSATAVLVEGSSNTTGRESGCRYEIIMNVS
jgi:hypothetical protein